MTQILYSVKNVEVYVNSLVQKTLRLKLSVATVRLDCYGRGYSRGSAPAALDYLKVNTAYSSRRRCTSERRCSRRRRRRRAACAGRDPRWRSTRSWPSSNSSTDSSPTDISTATAHTHHRIYSSKRLVFSFYFLTKTCFNVFFSNCGMIFYSFFQNLYLRGSFHVSHVK